MDKSRCYSGTTTRGGNTFVKAFNDMIPDTGAGTVSIPVHVQLNQQELLF